ncbi:MAG: hypothetical protein IE921_02210 [Rhodobacteraceae bacterium]|nr:hypothetical protein [Paracoccaceae bacterium]
MVDANVFLADSNEAGPLFENMHFGFTPTPGDNVEIDGRAYSISSVIHTPSVYGVGAKVKVTLRAK